MIDIASFQDNAQHGQFGVVEDLATYLKTCAAFLLFLFRMRNLQGDGLPETLKDPLEDFVAQPSSLTLHTFLLALFAPFTSATARTAHPMAWFVLLTARREGGSFVTLTEIRHTLVHLIFLIRLTTFHQLTLNPEIAYSSITRRNIMKMVRMT